MEYSDISLSSAKTESRKKWETIQNKALRCALNKDKYYNMNELHKEAKLQKLNNRRKIISCGIYT